MYIKSKIEYIKAITPIHAGVGQDLGIADMPIQREKHSNIPKIEASTLKGSIKSYLYHKLKKTNTNDDEKALNEMYAIFGSKDGNDSASLIGFTDAKLLLFPIKSTTKIFKLITCPYILKRWEEDLRLSGNPVDNLSIDDLKVDEGEAVALEEEENKIILEEYIFTKAGDKTGECKKGLENLFKKLEDIDKSRIILLSDSDFIELVTMYTEIITRNRITVETGVAKDTGLFTEEYLPAETVLYFTVLNAANFKADKNEDSIGYFDKNIGDVFQVGGDFTIGKGFVKRLDISKGSGENDEPKGC
ncbi:type III-B CRISPR module RAMP protein Cmr4 [Clostridium sp. HV4-5-A1G]|jgi:CRISPR-associated protein Cmr4|uniref:type III-B CRISPR module RAMP protein Cmr4 n=1 Tax=Clostridium sp. HV4-5-A1G TaxID=2004595 RepID=UPI00123B69F5|nr:type III-B CRISPR module RAMP protein Cmr4 [Clostridium sp. HV4-5-A1G]KAA8674817.1 type III-B CRISPR module RAMP protein Cmr4 [Clostridium sp. HV4-5-A1G]